MSLTEKDAFKLGFLARCAEENLHGEALDHRILAAGAWAATEKTAEGLFKVNPLNIGVGPTVSSVGSLAKGLGTFGAGMLTLPFAVGIPAAAGVGYGTAKMLEPDVSDEDIRAQELAATYKLYADKAKARRKSRKYRVEGGSEY
jgi:hypothetical protein